jgi:hypothetical protein
MEIDKRCAPSKKYENGSCFSIDSLKKIANKYNENNSEKIKITDDKKTLVNNITNAFKNSCDNQICWLRVDIVKSINDEEIHDNTFRPIGPDKQYQWLSTSNINEVIEQYHAKYPEFLFLGAVPYDFYELNPLGIRNLNLKNLYKKGKTKIGLVINLDEHDQSGSHWVALYADLEKNQVYFFDSVGKKPGKKIKRFINKLVNFIYKNKKNVNIDIGKIINLIDYLKDKTKKNEYINKLTNMLSWIDIRYNNIQHQFKNSECGVYSINFIVRLVGGESFDNIINNITKDDKMNECRESYFRNVNIK